MATPKPPDPVLLETSSGSLSPSSIPSPCHPHLLPFPNHQISQTQSPNPRFQISSPILQIRNPTCSFTQSLPINEEASTAAANSCGGVLNSHQESLSIHTRNCDFVHHPSNDKVRAAIALDLSSFPLLTSNPNLNSTTNQLYENLQISIPRTLEMEKSTWASKLGTKGIGKTKLCFIPPTMVNGEPVIHLESSQFGKLQQKNENLLIGSFVSKRESFEFVKGIVSKAWELKGKFTMKFYGRKSFSFAFEEEEDKAKAIEFGNFHIASQVFLVRPWKLFIEADLKNLETIPIWVMFKKIPEELWNGDGFSRIASAIGDPLYADRKTEQKSKTDYARICIDVKATSTFPTIVPVVVDKKRVFRITTEYNWRPPHCIKCKVFGHSESNCARLHQEKRQTIWVQKATPVDDSAKEVETHEANELIERGEKEQESHEEVSEESAQEQENNGMVITITNSTTPSHHPNENINQDGETNNLGKLDLMEDAVVSTITPMATPSIETTTIQVNNGFHILENVGIKLLSSSDVVPESLKGIIDEVALVTKRMEDYEKGIAVSVPLKTLTKTYSKKSSRSASSAVSAALRKSQRDICAPDRLDL